MRRLRGAVKVDERVPDGVLKGMLDRPPPSVAHAALVQKHRSVAVAVEAEAGEAERNRTDGESQGKERGGEEGGHGGTEQEHDLHCLVL